MKRKLIALSAAFCLVLSSCTMKEDTPEHTTATTPLTLTESITEEKPFVPEPPEEKKEPAPKIILALYDPFSDVPKPDDSLYRELSEAVGIISDARGFLYANPTAFHFDSKYRDNYADTNKIIEHNDEEEYTFYPVNTEYVSTEQELYDRLRGIFTENYISDEEMEKELFAPDEVSHDGQPYYKTVDGVLCMKIRYMGVMTGVSKDGIIVLSYDENTAKVIATGQSIDGTPHVYMTLKRSADGVWQLDEYEQKDYLENEANLLYNAVILNTEKLNRILGGGNTPDDPLTIEVDGTTYVETDLDMTIDEMLDFFQDIFFVHRLKKSSESDPYESFIDGDLLEEYRNKYIDWVYYEQDGVLYRKADAPKWYLPELRIDPYSKEIRSAGGFIVSLFGMNGGEFFIWEQPFYDESGESFTAEVTVCGKFAEEYDGYEFVRIAGKLPIMERTS